MSYSKDSFHENVLFTIKNIKGSEPTEEECKAISHHMEYNIRADWRYAKNGHRTISVGDLRNKIVEAIRDTLNPENIPEYVKQYQRYKEYQKNWQLTAEEKKDLGHIAIGNKKVSDFPDKDY